MTCILNICSLSGEGDAIKQHAGGVGANICGDDVESAIAVHIAQSHGACFRSRGEAGLSLKGTIAIAQEYADAVRAKISGDNVEFTIAIHIAHCQGSWTR